MSWVWRLPASDNCDMPDAVVTYVDSDTLLGCGPTFEFTRTFTATATDAVKYGRFGSCSHVITVVDTTARPSTWPQQTLRLSATVRATQLTSTHGLPATVAPALLMLAAV